MIQLIPPKPFRSNDKRSAAPTPLAAAPEYQSVERLDRGRVVVFIDGASLFYAAMQMEIEVDYTRLLSRLIQGGRLIHAHFYTGVDPSNEKQKGNSDKLAPLRQIEWSRPLTGRSVL